MVHGGSERGAAVAGGVVCGGGVLFDLCAMGAGGGRLCRARVSVGGVGHVRQARGVCEMGSAVSGGGLSGRRVPCDEFSTSERWGRPRWAVGHGAGGVQGLL